MAPCDCWLCIRFPPGCLMPEILITSRQQVIDFLKARSVEDTEIKWKCPRCGTVNLGAYYSHGSPCGGCDNFVFPRLNLKQILRDNEEASEIAKQIKTYFGKIMHQKEIIEDLRCDLRDEERRLDDLRDELKSLKSCDMDKVKGWE